MNDRQVRMRRKLYQQLWDASEDYKKQPQPCPIFDDGEIVKRLQELLGLHDFEQVKAKPLSALIFSLDLKSPIKSLWLGWWLFTWSCPIDGEWWVVEDFDVCFNPGD